MIDEKMIYKNSDGLQKGQAQTDAPIISMRGVGVRYDNNPEILSDVDLDIKRGSFHFLTGASGVGKTTLLSLMYMANQPARGKLSLFGNNIENMNRDQMALMKRRMGVIFQDYRLLDNLTVFDNVVLPLMIAGKSQKYVDKYVPDLLQWIGLGKYIYECPRVLSGGQKQRVAIARAVITKPDLIIADEPTGNVDDEMAIKLLYLFIELNRMGTAVVIATHSKALTGRFNYPVIEIKNKKIFLH